MRLAWTLCMLLPSAASALVKGMGAGGGRYAHRSALEAVHSRPRSGLAIMSPLSPANKAQRLVRKRLDLMADVSNMDEAQLRKYAYALQMEVRRLVREEKNASDFRDKLRQLIDADTPPRSAAEGAGGESEALSSRLSPEEEAELIATMKAEGLVRYGLAYATAATDWERLRQKNDLFSGFSDEELLAAFRASGKGISGTFGDLF